jgi:hypothetical protein
VADDKVGTVPKAISDLRVWFEARRDTLATLGFTADFKDSPSDRAKRSAALTVTSPRRIGQLVVWDTGEAELSLADIRSRDIVEEHREITSQAGIQDAAETLLAWLKQS